MSRNNILKIVLLLSLCFLLIGIVSAVNSNDTVTSEHNIKKSGNDFPGASSHVINKKMNVKDNYVDVKTAASNTKQKSKLTLALNQSKAILNDKIKVSVTLKDSKNKPIQNQKISIKIGTKTYNVITNIKGKSSLTYKIVSKNVLGKNITATYAGNSKYNKAVARKVLLSNEQSYYTKQMIVLGKTINKIAKIIKDNTTFSSFYNEYDYKTKLYNSANTLLNKDIVLLSNLKKYVTDKNRLNYIDSSIKEFKLVKNAVSQLKYLYDTSKLFYDGKISYGTFENRISGFENKIAKIGKDIDSIEAELNLLEKKYPYVIKGFEKFINTSI